MWLLISCTAPSAIPSAEVDPPLDSTAVEDIAPDSAQDTGVDEVVSAERELLRKAVGFYGAQRCGDAANWIIADHELGGVCHLEDRLGAASLIGGWHDAGDHIKPTLTIAYAAYVLLKAHQAWPEAFDDLDGNGRDDVLDEVEIAVDYLLRAMPEGELVVMVGGEEDHAVFVTSPFQSGLPVAKGGGARRVTTEGRADVAGMLAASMALASVELERSEALDVAEQAFAWGKANPGGSSADFYEGSDPDANMLCGAAELWAATGEGAYLDEALALDAAVGRTWWVPTWDNPADFGRHTLVAGGQDEVARSWQRDAEGFLEAVGSEPSFPRLAFFTDWGSLGASTASAASAGLLYEVTGDERFADYARGQVAWVMGDNDFAHPFVIGLEGGPTNPHHANAYGHDDLDTDWTLSPRHELTGALVGGPKSEAMYGFEAGYDDDVTDWISNEVTLDYNAGLVAATAFVVARDQGTRSR